MRARKFKTYVDTTTGIVYDKPVSLAGVPFRIKDKFYEITREQADRLESGEPMAKVIREGVEAKVQAEVEKIVETQTPEAVEEAPKKAPEKIDLEIVETIRSKKDIEQYAKDCGVDIPGECDTFTKIKDHLTSL